MNKLTASQEFVEDMHYHSQYEGGRTQKYVALNNDMKDKEDCASSMRKVKR